MRNFGFEQSGAIGLLTYDGELTVQHTRELKSALMRALDRVDHLIFNLEKVTAMDIACFQLLCMAQRISRRLNKRLTVIGFRQKSFKRLFEDARLRHKDCVLDCLKAVCGRMGGDRSKAKTSHKRELP
ncbi:MAG: STAS domain-containing protein [Nitrospirae bacterium]|nr:STAS domain-containing protein [Nitrospirota bacterium]MCL5236928.1 STAS domain-containing protein [Nitrospirota bacterium]